MHARLSLALIVGGVFSLEALPAAAQVRLPLPVPLQETLSWREDPEFVLRGFEVRVEGGRVPRAFAATHARRGSTASTSAPGTAGAMRRRRPSTGDVPIAADPTRIEVRPSLVTSPRRHDGLVVAYLDGSDCLVRRSSDRGGRWSEPVRLPTLSAASVCGTPVLAYSHEGRDLYAAYQDLRVITTLLVPDGSRIRQDNETDIVVVRSSDDGRTWTPPVAALDAPALTVWYDCPGGVRAACVPRDFVLGASYERPSIAAGGDGSDGSGVYVAATRVPNVDIDGTQPPTIVDLARSHTRGRSWSPPVALDEGRLAGTAGPTVLTQGPRVATGRRGEVHVAWYHSAGDGPRFGTFEIRTRRSGSRGQTWGPVVVAAANEPETGEVLGPAPFARRWFTSMFPSALIDRDGRAHIIYTHDPEPFAPTAEQGDIRHVSSPGPPYTDWSEPVTVNDDGLDRSQGFPSLATRRQGRASLVEVAWEDTRFAPDSAPGLTELQAGVSRYDVFHSRLVPASGMGWSTNRRVSDVSSVQNGASTNDRTALAASDTGFVFAVWSDRRFKTGPADSGDDIYGSGILP